MSDTTIVKVGKKQPAERKKQLGAGEKPLSADDLIKLVEGYVDAQKKATKQQLSRRGSTTSKYFAMILYPREDPNHKGLLDHLDQRLKDGTPSVKHAYVEHEEEVYTENHRRYDILVEGKSPEDCPAVGSIIKPHVHLLGWYPIPESSKAYKRMFWFWEINHVEIIKNAPSYATYMLHRDEASLVFKKQYSFSDVKGDSQFFESLCNKLIFYANGVTDKVIRVIKFCEEYNCRSYTECILAAKARGYDLIIEHLEDRQVYMYVIQHFNDLRAVDRRESDKANMTLMQEALTDIVEKSSELSYRCVSELTKNLGKLISIESAKMISQVYTAQQIRTVSTRSYPDWDSGGLLDL